MAVVECDNLIKIHKQGPLEVVALQGLDFSMAEQEFVAIVGRSGAGKSTLLRILAALEQPSAGRVVVADHDVGTLSGAGQTSHFRGAVGIVWQDYTRNLVPYLPVGENVELPMLFAGLDAATRRERTSTLLDAVGLSAKRHAALDELSGGEQQRVALAVGLALRPRLLLADEPTGELDTARSIEVYEMLRAMSAEWGLSILVVTHDAALAERADRAVRIDDGRLIADVSGSSLVPVDGRGRLQLPREALSAVGIIDRARFEVADDAIVLRRPG